MKEETFLNGWIGVRLAEEWLRARGFRVESKVAQRRGTEKATSSGDIDLVAKKGSETIYIEVKFWGSGSKKYTLSPSWLVEFMLDRRKLNTLFERHEDATGYWLLYRYPASGTFVYGAGLQFVKRLISRYEVPQHLIQELSGQSRRRFVEEVLRFLVHKKVGKEIQFEVIYFDRILRELGKEQLKETRSVLRNEALTLFDEAYSTITGGLDFVRD